MADEQINSVSLKALVDKVNNKVIFAESDDGFIDVVLSFLTMPLGTIIRLTRNQPPAEDISCMSNLYVSVENFDMWYLWTTACKTMLLCLRSVAETHCRVLRFKIDDTEPLEYFLCSSRDCTYFYQNLLSNHRDAHCSCGQPMSRKINLSNSISKELISAVRDGVVFVKGLTRILLSDDLQVMPPSTAASFSFLSKLGVKDSSTMEEGTFDVGAHEVLKLLKCSLISKTPLTETLLKHKPVTQVSRKDFNQEISVQSQTEPEASNGDGKICVKLIVCKSRNMVCYAEAGEDFIDLLFSFLTLPLGYIVKKMQGSSSKGCIDHLYSVWDLDAVYYIKSEKHKAMLVSPKVAPGFRYKNQPFDIEEASHPPYYYAYGYTSTGDTLTNYETTSYNGGRAQVLTVVDPKSHYNETRNGGGFVRGPALFTVTDSLVITPISPFSSISALDKLNVPFDDIEERIVYVGNEEALRLLVALFMSESALTNAFIRRETKQE